MDMPVPDAGILARKARIVARLRAVLPQNAVIDDAHETRAYECDALTAYNCPPLARRPAGLDRGGRGGAARSATRRACRWCRAARARRWPAARCPPPTA